MLDLIVTSIHRALTTPAGDRFFPIRVPKDLARRVNALLGEPICSTEELARRRSGRERLEMLKRNGGKSEAPARSAPAPMAPVTIYFEQDRNLRVLGRIKEMLEAKEIKYTLADITSDPTTKDFVLREAKCEDDDLPVVFVASTAVGGYNELVDWDVSGRLAKALKPN
ncbi:MAG TPA: hypothetical protein VM580_21475 [Labilithrix sp.]|jgi:glutaredoxin|nr:hypothetical protein [Labilithrix sp.]